MKARQQAFTLVELMIFSGVGLLLLMAVGFLLLFTARSVAGMESYNDLNRKSRYALDVLTRDIRGVQKVSNFGPNFLEFVDYDTGKLRYDYDSQARTLTRQKNDDVPQVLLTECDSLNFHVYQRTPAAGFKFNSTTQTNLAKLIDVSWKCSRRILASQFNSETAQTAKIVMRN